MDHLSKTVISSADGPELALEISVERLESDSFEDIKIEKEIEEENSYNEDCIILNWDLECNKDLEPINDDKSTNDNVKTQHLETNKRTPEKCNNSKFESHKTNLDDKELKMDADISKSKARDMVKEEDAKKTKIEEKTDKLGTKSESCSITVHFNTCDMKVFTKTSVAIENCSDFLKNCLRYCFKCETLFPMIYSFDNHLIDCQPLLLEDYKNRFFCHFCNIVLKTKLRLEEHLLIHRGAGALIEKNRNVGKRGYYKKSGIICVICQEKFETKKSLYNHINIEHFVSFQCNQCNAEYPLQEVLNDHIRLIHTPKNRPPAICCYINKKKINNEESDDQKS